MEMFKRVWRFAAIAAVVSTAVLSCKSPGQNGEEVVIRENEVTGIEITGARTVYGLGETLDLAGIEVTATSDSGTGSFAVTAAHLSHTAAPNDAKTSFTITVTVNDCQDTFTIDVFPVVSIHSLGGYTGYDDLDAAFVNPADRDTITLYANQTIGNGKNPEGKTVTLNGYDSERKITHTAGTAMFELAEEDTVLILGENITLDGEDKNNASASLG